MSCLVLWALSGGTRTGSLSNTWQTRVKRITFADLDIQYVVLFDRQWQGIRGH